MKKIFFLITIVSASLIVEAQNPAKFFEQANNAYKEAKYDSAIVLYERIVAQNMESPELYFNLGNAYYRKQDIAKAIVNYERALLLSPNDNEIKQNLEKARQQVSQKVKPLSEFFLSIWFNDFSNLLSVSVWTGISIASFLFMLFFIALFVFSSKLSIRKLAISVSLVLLVLFFATLSSGLHRKDLIISHRFAIVLNSSVTTQSAPNSHGSDLFTLHEGIKVEVKSVRDNWAEIRLADGKIAWLPVESIELI